MSFKAHSRDGCCCADAEFELDPGRGFRVSLSWALGVASKLKEVLVFGARSQ